MRIFFFVILSVILSACSMLDRVSTEGPEDRIVVLEHDAWIKGLDGEGEFKKSGSEIKLSGKPLLIESPGRVGILVLPNKGNVDKINVELRPIKNWAGDASKELASNMTSNILEKIEEIKNDLNNGSNEKALDKTRILRNEYPNVSYLKLVEVSCLMVLNHYQEAKKILSDLRVENPNNENVQNLYRSIASERDSP